MLQAMTHKPEGDSMTESGKHDQLGQVVAIAYRPTDGAAMQPLNECTVLEKRGLGLENRRHGKREVTLLSEQRWRETCRDLGAELNWHIRRANFLVSGVDLAACIDRRIAVGDVEVWIHGETRPCGLMDRQQEGLTNALKPDCRGGVHGQVVAGGRVRVGDVVRRLSAAEPAPRRPSPS